MNSSCASSRQSRTDPLSGPSESTGLTEASGSSVQAAETANPPLAPLHCLMCRSLQHRVVFTESGIDILRCEDCGHVFSSFRADPHYSGYWGADVAPGEHHYWSKARKKMHRDFFQRFDGEAFGTPARYGKRARVLRKGRRIASRLGRLWLRNLSCRRQVCSRTAGAQECGLQPASGCGFTASFVRHHHDLGRARSYSASRSLAEPVPRASEAGWNTVHSHAQHLGPASSRSAPEGCRRHPLGHEVHARHPIMPITTRRAAFKNSCSAMVFQT